MALFVYFGTHGLKQRFCGIAKWQTLLNMTIWRSNKKKNLRFTRCENTINLRNQDNRRIDM